MALYTLNELHGKIADQINVLVQKEDFRIAHDKYDDTYNENIFKATLVKGVCTIEFYAYEKDDTFIKTYLIVDNKSHVYDHFKKLTYYKVHDDIYADSKLEADNERVKWYASFLCRSKLSNQ
jgi:hypothetical protein